MAFSSAQGFSVILGRGDGTFFAPVYYAIGAISGIAKGDFNGDGKQDLVVGNQAGVAIVLGNGDGTFAQPNISALKFGVSDVAVGDFNRDGKSDVALVGRYAAVLFGNGDGTLRSPVYYTALVNQIHVTVGDVNGDGNPDLITNDEGDVNVSLGTSDGKFQPPVSYAVGAPPDVNVLADTRGKGTLDIMTTNYYGQSMSVLLNEGNGTFVEGLTLTGLPSGSSPKLVPGDFNGDGREDVIQMGEAAIQVLIGTGDPRSPFQNGQQLKFASGIAYDCVAGDFNGDGKLDLAVSLDFLPDGNSILVYPGNGDGTFSAPLVGPEGLSNYNGRLAAGDFNNDGKLDLATSAGYLFVGNGDGTFQAPVAIYNQPPGGYIIAGDFNGDGKLDVIMDVYCRGHLGPACLGLFLGQGNGTFRGPLRIADSAQGGAILAAADLNADGNLDLVFSGYDSSLGQCVVGILLGNGDGTFRTMTEVMEPFWSSYVLYSVLVADLNGDGIPDLAVTVQNQDVCVFLGNGDGTFALAGNFGALTGDPAITIAGLFQERSKSGWSDFIVANPNGGAMVLLNDSRK